ncbi:2,3-diaminopropionate biosynthesis protein SbnB [Cutibacterium sp. WCA-380-WT-3A]|uniref:2,3-diaminopropionate biosynthesis protein SbnB n=1 Tax=Cutibacterium porci TaxID=2605781 RepID=A0A7K0J3U9_9ACTN|nr:2,3-diaminopropionate biosynthesis protein SbnB [Cutibacterium porci]MSS44612.1 2,3-diaminopropionate biosynthesis protein SbnB [Cutibacterium porci]
MKLFDRDAVEKALADRHEEVLNAVQSAYMLHSSDETSLPFSTFLRPKGHPDDRIIGLPAHVGGEFRLAGIKWISSFPGNLNLGMQRASSVLILNSLETGYPTALLESSRISATRTAASAALASATLHGTSDRVDTIGVIGCGTINIATIDYLFHVHPQITTVIAVDVQAERAQNFARIVKKSHPSTNIHVATDLDAVLREADTVAIATTDSSHWLTLPPWEKSGHQVVLHTSLRDLSVASLLAATNVVDDPDHVCREATTPDLAAQQTGNRDFIAARIGDLLLGTPLETSPNSRIIFSPFGLGILDLAVASVVMSSSSEAVEIDGFDPGTHATSTIEVNR